MLWLDQGTVEGPIVDVLGDGGKNMPSHKGECARVFNRGCKKSKGRRAGNGTACLGTYLTCQIKPSLEYEAKTVKITQTQ